MATDDEIRAILQSRDKDRQIEAELKRRSAAEPPQVPPEMVFDPRTGGYVDTQLAAERMPGYSQMSAAAIRGVPFVGEYADEMMGRLSSTPGAEQIMRRAAGVAERERPGAAMLSQIGAGLAASAPAAAMSLPAAGGSMLARIASGMGIGAATGGVEGAFSGYGAGEGDNRMSSAIERGALGAGIGGALGAAAPVAGAGVEKVGEWFASRPTRAAAKELGVSNETAMVLKSIAEATDEDEAQRVLNRMGGDAFLADLSPAARGVLDTAMQGHSEAGQIAQRAITGRIAGTATELEGVLDDVLGVPTGRSVVRQTIREPVAQEIADAYTMAYQTPIDYASDAGQRITDLMGRLPPKKLNAAIEEANDMLRFRGIDADQILLQVSDDGEIVEQPLMNVAQLDYLKRAFDKIKRDGTDPITGKLSSEAKFAGEVAGEIRNATRAASPAYGEALRLSSDTLAQEAAVDLGARMMRPAFTRDMLSREIKDMTEGELRGVRQGVREYLDDAMANARKTLASPDVTVDEVKKITRELSTRAARSKLASLLGREQGDKVFRQLDKVSTALELKAATAANSRTFGREVTRQAIDDLTSTPILDSLKQGRALQAGQEVVQLMTGTSAAAKEARNNGLLSEIASSLVNIQGAKAERALRLLKDVDVSAPLSRARANAVANALNPLWIQAEQTMTRELTEDR